MAPRGWEEEEEEEGGREEWIGERQEWC